MESDRIFATKAICQKLIWACDAFVYEHDDQERIDRLADAAAKEAGVEPEWRRWMCIEVEDMSLIDLFKIPVVACKLSKV